MATDDRTPTRRIAATTIVGDGRIVDHGSTLWFFKWPLLVECPRCGGQARITFVAGNGARVTCGGCAFTRQDGGTDTGARFAKVPVAAKRRCPDCGRWNERTGSSRATSPRLRLRCACGCTYDVPATVTTRPGGTRDPHFGLPLWLQLDTRHGALWACNAEHLAWLDAVVGATLRERTAASGNGALLSRLPRWLKAAKNRGENLRALARLRQRLTEGV